ncbi:hypothetical protein FQR65_LT13232 [Abscondita terminalis]|nr:hypothetical protein FQR65_LT13232 [Abscondita terminalis]
MNDFFKHIDRNVSNCIKELAEIIAIPSISRFVSHRDQTNKMINWVADRLTKLGVTVTLRDLGNQLTMDGNSISLPPVILGNLTINKNHKTVCIYGNVDVFPVVPQDKWVTNPFELTERDGKLYGRGTNASKGPLLCWIYAIEGLLAVYKTLPVNLKFIIDVMEDCLSDGLEKLIREEKDNFFNDVDYIAVSSGNWLGRERPCIIYGLRGFCHYALEIKSTIRELHSGIFGGIVHDSISDLIYMLNTLIDGDGTILIPDINKNVDPLTEEEDTLYAKIDFDIFEFRNIIGSTKLTHNEDQTTILQHLWRFPCLSIHGIEGSYCNSGDKSLIPSKVIGKFSIRIVPNQNKHEVSKTVNSYLRKKWLERNSPNKMKVTLTSAYSPYINDPSDPHFIAAHKAIEQVYNVTPEYVRDGSSIAVVPILKNVLKKNVIILPICSIDCGARSQNEKIYIRNLTDGAKFLGTYLHEVSLLS